MDLPAILRTWRDGFTAREAAAALNVPLTTYNGWEQGRPVSRATLGPLLIAIQHVRPGAPDPQTKKQAR